ncbi:MAG: hypothetical protein COT84_03690 [Chlamydiae bacterium CG10_big_fil_rev_8_21_14_0_10_35_9]|nr:MAG: hypothetical protein COT84_03690 [Chlamydiae bacterium CG10_big_fil_rev_8_21_14_0_10_35_9]
MKILKKIFGFFAIFIGFLCISLFSFTLINNLPFNPIDSYPVIGTTLSLKEKTVPKSLKVMTYNIHYGVGLTATIKEKIDRNGFKERLDELANILIKSDADIVFLQEVDLYSNRSYRINQAKYLAEKAQYSFYATAPQWKRRLFPDYNGRHGQLSHGLCILSKFPLRNNISKEFTLSREIPFFVKWLYNPHGVQKADVQVGEKIITLVNLHLDPWSKKEREKQISHVLTWINQMKGPKIIGGDFNVQPPEDASQTAVSKKDSHNEQTVELIRSKGFTQDVSKEKYIKDPRAYFSFPSNDPQVKLDYLFTGNGIKISHAHIFMEAATASDHLPVLAEIQLSP